MRVRQIPSEHHTDFVSAGRERVVAFGVAMGRVVDVIRPDRRMNEGVLRLLVVRYAGNPSQQLEF
ncbi:hypothetical protein [Mesorhizobium sp. M1143]|uniref:hypothetical protein n=1 Tax=Mesorhizobium sp. M1143 TaxID=2957061 RepID=UPI0033352847